jgi:hypothetical protein
VRDGQPGGGSSIKPAILYYYYTHPFNAGLHLHSCITAGFVILIFPLDWRGASIKWLTLVYEGALGRRHEEGILHLRLIGLRRIKERETWLHFQHVRRYSHSPAQLEEMHPSGHKSFSVSFPLVSAYIHPTHYTLRSNRYPLTYTLASLCTVWKSGFFTI